MNAAAPSNIDSVSSAEKTRIAQQQVRLLEVTRAELLSVKPGRAVYQRRGDLLLLTDPREARARVEEQLDQARRQAAAVQAAARLR